MNNQRINEIDLYIKKNKNSLRVNALRDRAKRCRCKYCGGKLRLKLFVYNKVIEPRVELYCETCERIEYGVEKEIYSLSKYYVENFKCDFYPDLDENILKERMNVGRICEIIIWALNGLGYVTMDGYKYPVEMNSEIAGENVVYDLDRSGERGGKEDDSYERK